MVQPRRCVAGLAPADPQVSSPTSRITPSTHRRPDRRPRKTRHRSGGVFALWSGATDPPPRFPAAKHLPAATATDVLLASSGSRRGGGPTGGVAGQPEPRYPENSRTHTPLPCSRDKQGRGSRAPLCAGCKADARTSAQTRFEERGGRRRRVDRRRTAPSQPRKPGRAAVFPGKPAMGYPFRSGQESCARLRNGSLQPRRGIALVTRMAPDRRRTSRGSAPDWAVAAPRNRPGAWRAEGPESNG